MKIFALGMIAVSIFTFSSVSQSDDWLATVAWLFSLIMYCLIGVYEWLKEPT